MKKIETETEYNYALARCYILMDSKPGSLDEIMLDEISKLIEEYEKEHFPIE